MVITQLSVFLENRPGTLAATIKEISEAGVNIRALSIADTKDFGVLRLIVSDIPKTKELLSRNALVTETKVIAVKMNDQAGALNDILQTLGKADINVEYLYAFTGSKALSAYVVLRVDDVEHAEAVLQDGNIAMLSDMELMEIL